MLQIIGWLGCVYLVVKACEILSNAQHRDEAGNLKRWALTGVVVAWLSAVAFLLLLNEQGRALPSSNVYPLDAG